MASPSEKWDGIYAHRAAEPPEAAEVLCEHTFLLPAHGAALDMACGLGGNALLLARYGLTVEAWDISAAALASLRQHAEAAGQDVRTRCIDIQPDCLAPQSFDVIVASRFLDRALCPAIIAALRPGGMLFYQTYTREKAVTQGPSNPAYLLGENELLQLFSELRIVFYREHGMIGDFAQGFRNQAQLIGQKRPLPETPYD